MAILTFFLLFVFVIVCILICFLVLIQSDKGGGISGAIGGGLGGANSLLGTQDTANILTRGTVIFGIVFFVLCIAMSFVMTKQTYSSAKSMLQKRAEKQQSYSPSSALGGGSMPMQQQGGGLPIAPAASQGAPGTPAAKQPSAPVQSGRAIPSPTSAPASAPAGKPMQAPVK